MNGITAVAGKDSLIINSRIFTGLADGDAINLEPQGPISQYKISKDGNSIISLQYSGILCKVTVRLVRDCADDVWLNGLLQQWINDPSTFALMAGTYLKRVGDGAGNVTNEVYSVAAGTFEAIPGAKTNTDGALDQNVTIYTLFFRNDARLQQ